MKVLSSVCKRVRDTDHDFELLNVLDFEGRPHTYKGSILAPISSIRGDQ